MTHDGTARTAAPWSGGTGMTEQPSGYTPPPPTAPPPAPPQQPGHPYPPYGSYPPSYPPSSPPAYSPVYGPYPGHYQPWAHPLLPPPAPRGPRRPGVATAAAVLAFIVAGLLLLAGIDLVFNASVIHSIGVQGGFDLSDATAELGFDAVVDVVAGALLLAGGLMLLGRRTQARTLLFLGVALDLGAAIYWLARTHVADGWIIFLAALFGTLGLVTGSLAVPPSVGRWLTTAGGADTDADTGAPTSGR
jgi:hypothetical protein